MIYQDLVGVGLTNGRRPFVVYGAFGSEDSNVPVVTPHKRMIGVEFSRETSLEPYKPIRVNNIRRFAVVGNIPRTGTVFKQMKREGRTPYGVLNSVLHHLENGASEYGTSPRIAGNVVIGGGKYTFSLGFAHPAGPKTLRRNNIQPGNALLLQAYAENGGDLSRRVNDAVIRTPIEGETSEELASSLAEMGGYPPL